MIEYSDLAVSGFAGFGLLLSGLKKTVKKVFDSIGLGGLLGAPKMPDVPAAPLTPDTDPAAQAKIAEAERLEREAQLRARGRASTILTGGAGDTSTANTARRTLLGG